MRFYSKLLIASSIFNCFLYFSNFASAQTQLSNCGEINIPGEYLITQNLISAGTCINVNTDNVLIDGGPLQNSITFSQSENGHGILVNTNVSNLEIKNITFIKGSYTGCSESNCSAIRRNGSVSAKIHGNHFELENRSNAYLRAIHFSNGSGTAGEIYANTASLSGTYAGDLILLSGSYNQFKIYNNQFEVSNIDSHDYRRTHLVSLIGSNDGTEIYENDFTAQIGTKAVQFVSNWQGSNANVHHNTFTTYGSASRLIHFDKHTNPNVAYNDINLFCNNITGACAGIRLRDTTNNGAIHHNKIVTECAESSTAGCIPIRIGGHGSSAGNYPYSNSIYQNSIETNDLALSFEQYSSGNLAYNNTIRVNLDGTYAYNLYPWHDPAPLEVDFSYNAIINDSGQPYSVRIIGDTGDSIIASSCADLVDDRPLAESDVIDSTEGSIFEITASECIAGVAPAGAFEPLGRDATLPDEGDPGDVDPPGGDQDDDDDDDGGDTRNDLPSFPPDDKDNPREPDTTLINFSELLSECKFLLMRAKEYSLRNSNDTRRVSKQRKFQMRSAIRSLRLNLRTIINALRDNNYNKSLAPDGLNITRAKRAVRLSKRATRKRALLNRLQRLLKKMSR